MSTLRSLVASSALMALLAVPGFAQTPEPQGAITKIVEGTAQLGNGSGETITDVSKAYVGNGVSANDGTAIGTVGSAATKDGGGTAIVVTLDPAIGADVSGFEITLAAGQVSDGTVELPWSKAELLGQLTNMKNSTATATGTSSK